MSSKIDRLLHSGLYLLVFLVPLFWLPLSFESWEFQKEFLLFFGGLAFLVLLLAKHLSHPTANSALTLTFLWPFDLLVVVLLSVSALSAVFSVDRTSSLFGFYGRFSDGWLGLAGFGVFYFLVSRRVLADTKYKILNTLLASALVSTVIAFLAVSGALSGLADLALALGQRNFNPVAPSLEGLVIFLAPLIFLAFEMAKRKEGESSERVRFPIFNLVFILASLILLALVDYHPAWIILGFVSFLYLVFLCFKKLRGEEKLSLRSQVFIPLLFLILAVLGTNFDTTQLFPRTWASFPREVTLDQETSWQVALATLKDKPLLGSGPATFFADFSRFKPAAFNQDPLWQIRFDRPISHLAEALATLGLAGSAVYLLLLLWSLAAKFSILNLRFANLFFVLLAVVIAQTVYYQNVVLGFTFWLLVGVIAGVMAEEKSLKLPSLSLDPNTLSGRFKLVLAWLATGLIILALVFGAFRVYLADFLYNRALSRASELEKTADLQQAIKTNPFFAEYDIILARRLLAQAQESIQQKDATKATQAISSALDSGRRAVAISPNWVAGWETLGLIYQESLGLVTGTDDWAIKSWERALELEPANPIFYSRLGKLRFLRTETDLAKEMFLKARDLKTDYLEPQLFLALIREKKGDTTGAIEQLSHLQERSPLNTDLIFQLGRLYFNHGQADQAIAQFQQVLKINPSHLDSLYSLALVYEQKGNKKEALSYLRQALELAPDNSTLQQKLEELEK